MNQILYLQNKGASSDFSRLVRDKHQVSVVHSLDEAMNIISNNNVSLCFVTMDFQDSDIVFCVQTIRKKLPFKRGSIVVHSNNEDGFAAKMVLDAGADDFWQMPSSKRLIKAKIRAILRRFDTNKAYNTRANNCKNLVIDKEKYLIELKGEVYSLSKKEFELMEMFAESPKKVFTREAIKDELWGKKKLNNERTIDVHIKNLREKIGDDLISTVKGVGYKLDCC